jgi:dienelactone hydrolase
MLTLINDGALKTTRLPEYDTNAELIRYQTQDRGSPIDATALVTFPKETGTFPVLLVLHGTSGFCDACAPTLGMTTGDYEGFDNDLGLLMSMYASFGYITVFPDYIGLKSLGGPTGFMHPYLVGEPTAIASLDAVRAAGKLLTATGPTPGDVVVIGGSQGGHAAAFVNRYAPHYAPEITIRGSVWDVPPTDMMEQTRAAWGSTWVNASDNAIAFFTAAESWYGSAPGGLSEILLPPYDTEVPQQLLASCTGYDFVNPTLETVVTPDALAAAKVPEFGTFEPWACYLRENSLASTSVPRADHIPSLFLLGEDDALVNNVVERAAFQELCAQGYELEYLECAGATHTKPLVWAFDQTLDFLEARLAGEPMPADTCQIKPPETCTSEP